MWVFEPFEILWDGKRVEKGCRHGYQRSPRSKKTAQSVVVTHPKETAGNARLASLALGVEDTADTFGGRTRRLEREHELVGCRFVIAGACQLRCSERASLLTRRKQTEAMLAWHLQGL